MESCIILVVIGSEGSFSMDITIKRYFRNIAEIQHAMYRQRIVTIAHLICFLWYHDFIDIPVYRRRDEWLTSEKCLNREREYGTMRYGRGMVTGRDLKKRGCREDSCIILFAPLFVPLSKLARANAIYKSQKCDRWPSPMKNPKTNLWSQLSTVSRSPLLIGTHTSDARKVLILVQFSITV